MRRFTDYLVDNDLGYLAIFAIILMFLIISIVAGIKLSSSLKKDIESIEDGEMNLYDDIKESEQMTFM